MPRISTELSIAQQEVTAIPTSSADPVRLRTNPIDLIAAWHFTNDSRWKPYVGLGLHYLYTGEGGRGLDSRTAGEVSGGVAYRFTSRFFVRADASVLLQHHPSYDQRNRSWIGFGWRF